MRLISMSAHTRMRIQDDALRTYITASRGLLQRIQYAAPSWEKNSFTKTEHASGPLVILVGSQKGLCGNFNSSLLQFFSNSYNNSADLDVIVVGKKLIDLAADKKIKTVQQYSHLHINTLATLARDLLAYIEEKKPISVDIVSNQLKSFFVQKPHITPLFPLNEMNPGTKPTEEYHWEQPAQEVLDNLLKQVITSQIQYILFQSLYAEQAARFLSMDNSTRNAQSLLEQTKLQYNKLRQAKITKELTELAGSNF